MRRLLLALLLPAAAAAQPPPDCTPARVGTAACIAEKLCLCRREPGGTVTGPGGTRWDCGALRPHCGIEPAGPIVPPMPITPYITPSWPPPR